MDEKSKVDRIIIEKSIFESESAVRVKNFTNESSSNDIDFYTVMYTKNTNINMISISDSTFRQQVPQT